MASVATSLTCSVTWFVITSLTCSVTASVICSAMSLVTSVGRMEDLLVLPVVAPTLIVGVGNGSNDYSRINMLDNPCKNFYQDSKDGTYMT